MVKIRASHAVQRLSDFTFTFHFHALEKEMVTHSSVLAWRIPGMAEPGGLPSMGSQSRTRLKRLSSMLSKEDFLSTNRKEVFTYCSIHLMRSFQWSPLRSVCLTSEPAVLPICGLRREPTRRNLLLKFSSSWKLCWDSTAHWLGMRMIQSDVRIPVLLTSCLCPRQSYTPFLGVRISKMRPQSWHTSGIELRAHRTQKIRHHLSEEWTGTVFFLNDRKFVAPKFQHPSTSFPVSSKKVHCSENQISPWGKCPCPCSRHRGDNRYLTDGGWSKWSRAAGSFSCKSNTDQPPWPTPPPG